MAHGNETVRNPGPLKVDSSLTMLFTALAVAGLGALVAGIFANAERGWTSLLLNHFFFISQMIVPGSSYWNVGIGREKGEVLNDDEGLLTMTNLGKNMAYVLKKLCA